jgi:hypothetical protein
MLNRLHFVLRGLLVSKILLTYILFSGSGVIRGQDSSVTPAQNSIVLPSGLDNVPGTTASGPFRGDERFLAIYGGVELVSAMPFGGTITQIAFRIDEAVRGGSREFDLSDLEIRMSTSPSLAAVVPSPTFADNVGPDETVVLPRGPVHLESHLASTGPNPLDLVVRLKTPFKYNPNTGSLAIDFRTYGMQIPSPLIDATPEGFLKTNVGLDGPVDFVNAEFFRAPVIQISFVPVPEPASGILILGGLFFTLIGKLRRGTCRYKRNTFIDNLDEIE